MEKTTKCDSDKVKTELVLTEADQVGVRVTRDILAAIACTYCKTELGYNMIRVVDGINALLSDEKLCPPSMLDKVLQTLTVLNSRQKEFDKRIAAIEKTLEDSAFYPTEEKARKDNARCN